MGRPVVDGKYCAGADVDFIDCFGRFEIDVVFETRRVSSDYAFSAAFRIRERSSVVGPTLLPRGPTGVVAFPVALR
jgi:hypothetical protein